MFPVWLKDKGKHRAGIGESRDIYQCLEKRVALEKHINLFPSYLVRQFQNEFSCKSFRMEVIYM